MSELTFENRQGLHSDWLELFAKHGERVIIVRVEAEALREYGRGDGMLERYFNYPEQFHDVAAWKLDAGLLEDDGSVMVRSADFDV